MNTLKYPGQPDNEIWFYDKDKPYYQLTNFYASPIECELPIQVIDGSFRYMPLDIKGNLSSGHKHFYNQGLDIVKMAKRKTWKELAKKEKAEKVKWNTSEHLYQVFKLTDWSNYLGGDYKGNGVYVELNGLVGEGLKGFNFLAMAINKIRNIPNPGEARDFVNEQFNFGNGLRTDWFLEERPTSLSWDSTVVVPMRLRAMRFAVREKFNQNPKLKKLLWETKNKKLVEHSPDNYWGDGGNSSGENWLGKILTEIRLEITHSAARREWNPSEIEAELSEPNSTNQKDTENEVKKTLIENNISEIKNKLSNANISTEQVIRILGNSWESNYQMSWVKDSEVEIENHKNSLLAKINEFITNNPNNGTNNSNEPDNNSNNSQNQGTNKPNTPPPPPKPTNSPEPPAPTSEQIKNTNSKLDRAQEEGVNEEELIKIIKETSETVKHSGDENLKKKKEEVEKKLSKEKLRELIREEIHQELVENKLKPEELSLTVKQKLDELNNNNNNDHQVIRTEVLNEIGKQKLWLLIKTLEQVLKAGQKTKVKNHLQELQQFINSKIDYKQNAYAKEKNKVDQLLAQARNQSNQNQTPVGFFRVNNLLLWLSSILVIGLIVFSALIVVRVRRRKQR